MSRQLAKWGWGLALAIPFAGQAQAQVDLTVLDRDMVGPRAQVLVLGTMHLSGMPKEFDPKALDPLLDKLAAFKPDIITIEALPGEECDMAARNPTVYGTDYCSSTHAAKAATGLDVPAAIAEASKTLKTWPAQPSPRSVVVWCHCSWRPTTDRRPMCSGCSCWPPSVARATASTMH